MRGTVRRLHAAMLVALLAATTVGAAAPVAAQSAGQADVKRALAIRIVAIAFPEDQRIAMISGVMDNLEAQMALPSGKGDDQISAISKKHLDILRAGIIADLDKNGHGLFEALASAYAREFTLQELQDIERFVSTPSGAAYVQRSSKLLGDPDVAAWNTAYFERIMALIEAQKEKLRTELIAHYAKTGSAN